MKTTLHRLLLAGALVAGASAALAAGPAAAPAGACELDLLGALTHLSSGDHVLVERRRGEVVLRDRASGELLLSATCEAVALPALAADVRPDPGQQAATRVLRDAEGQPVVTLSQTARGARVLIIAAGELGPAGVHVMTFDNDDFHVSDGRGALVQSRTTAPTGELTERQGPTYGCGCERRVLTDGRVERRKL